MSGLALLLGAWVGASAPVLPPRWAGSYAVFPSPGVDSLASDPQVMADAAYGHPAVLSVKFLPLASDRADAEDEDLWVRILDRDPVSGTYLGVLVQKPARLRSVALHQNVLFRFSTMLQLRPRALVVGDSYLAHPGRRTAFDRAFVEGVSAQRELAARGGEAALEGCANAWKKTMGLADASTRRRDQFLSRYLLGRCYADVGMIDSSIAWFSAARSVDSTDLDGAMSLLGDLSVRYGRQLVDRNVKAALATKETMRRLADEIRRRDTPDRRYGAMVDQIYACEVPARAARKDPCNTLRYLR